MNLEASYQLTRCALAELRGARSLLRKAGNPQAIKAVRRAIKSVEGSARYLNNKRSPENFEEFSVPSVIETTMQEAEALAKYADAYQS